MTRLLLSTAALAALLAAPASLAQPSPGRLASGDGVLGSGEYVDEYAVRVRQGQTVRAEVTSQAFDTYVIVKTETGAQAEDDDCVDGETTRSCAELAADVDGQVRVLVTSFRPGETGEYRIAISVDGAEAPAQASGTALSASDERLGSGERFDRFAVQLAAGETRRVVLSSDAFDPYLIATGPGEARLENDDCTEGDPSRACLELTADVGGVWSVIVTSFRPGEGGAYDLDLGGEASGTRLGSRETDRAEDGR